MEVHTTRRRIRSFAKHHCVDLSERVVRLGLVDLRMNVQIANVCCEGPPQFTTVHTAALIAVDS